MLASQLTQLLYGLLSRQHHQFAILFLNGLLNTFLLGEKKPYSYVKHKYRYIKTQNINRMYCKWCCKMKIDPAEILTTPEDRKTIKH